MLSIINDRSKIAFQSIAKLISKSAYADLLFENMFQRVLKIFQFPSFGFGGKGRSWCELNKSLGYCHQPNGRFCSKECRDGYGIATRCPQGFHPSHAWGYRVTGCWCDTFRGRSIVCCDCTPVTNSPYQPSAEDCGCMHYLD